MISNIGHYAVNYRTDALAKIDWTRDWYLSQRQPTRDCLTKGPDVQFLSKKGILQWLVTSQPDQIFSLGKSGYETYRVSRSRSHENGNYQSCYGILNGSS